MTEKEFSKLYELSRNNFERIAFSYLYDKEMARDIVSDCFIYLWEHRAMLTHENIKGYVYLTLRSKCISHLRRQQNLARAKAEISDIFRYRLETSINSLSESNMTEPIVFSSEITGIFRKSLEKMPELTRKIFVASRNEDMTYQQISIKYGISVRKVTAEITAALKILRKSLKDYRI